MAITADIAKHASGTSVNDTAQFSCQSVVNEISGEFYLLPSIIRVVSLIRALLYIACFHILKIYINCIISKNVTAQMNKASLLLAMLNDYSMTDHVNYKSVCLRGQHTASRLQMAIISITNCWKCLGTIYDIYMRTERKQSLQTRSA